MYKQNKMYSLDDTPSGGMVSGERVTIQNDTLNIWRVT
jgi:hypothetical protein